MARVFTSTIAEAAEVRAAGFDTVQGVPTIERATTGERAIQIEHETRTITLAKKTGLTLTRERAYFLQVPIELSARPSAAQDIITTNGAVRARFGGSEARLRLLDNAGATLATSTELSTGRKYVVEIKWVQKTSTTGEWEFRIDGASIGSGRAANVGEGREIIVGHNAESRTGFRQWVIGEVKLNDGTGETQNSWPTSAASLEGAASLRGAGTISGGSGRVSRSGAAALAGTGALTSGAKAEFKNEARLEGRGTLAGTGPVTHKGEAALRGAGTLAAAAYITHKGEAPLRGTGTLSGGTGVVARNVRGAATLAGTSRLTAAGIDTGIGVAALSGRGALSVTEGPVTRHGEAALRGAGASTSAGTTDHIGAAPLVGAGALVAAGRREQPGAAVLSGRGTLRAEPSAASTKRGEAVLRGIGTMIAELIGYFSEVSVDFPSAWFHLDETRGAEAADAEGGVAGSYNGEYTLNQSGLIYGTVDPSVLFRRNAYVRVADRASIDPGDNFTIECWVYPTAYGDESGLASTFFDKGRNAFIFRFADVKDGTFILRCNEVGTVVTSTARVPLNRISHIAAKKAGESVRLFLNGRDVTGIVTNVTMQTNELPLTIGAADNGTHNFFNGRIDEVAIYPTGLEDSRVLAHYNAGKAPVVGEAVLAGSGTMAVSGGAVGRTGGAVLQGAGSLVGGEGFKGAVGGGSFAGSGSASASGRKEAFAQAAATGLGTLGAIGRKDYVVGAVLAGSGALSGGNGRKTAKASAALPGVGLLLARTTTEREGAARLEGRGTLASGAGFRTAQSTASSRSEGSLTGNGRVSHIAEAVLPGRGRAEARGVRTSLGAGLLVGSGALVGGNGRRSTVSASRLSGVGGMVVGGIRIISASARLGGVGFLLAGEAEVNPTFPPGFISLHEARSTLEMEVSI